MNLTNIEEVKRLLDRHGFRFSKSMGQNFLVASWVPEDIAESAGLDENTGVLEIGPGIGCLTNELAQRAGKVVSVELDKSLKKVLAETLAGHDNVSIVYGDILKQNLDELVAEHFKGQYKTLQLGTGESPLTLPFYEKCGFVQSHRIKNFYTDNYDHPIIEAGVQLVDMVYLKKEI